MGKYVVKNTNTGVKFDLKAGNGEIIANSEVYTTKAACMNGIKSVKTNAPVAAVEDQTVEGFEKCKHPKFEVLLESGDFIHSESGEIRQSESINKNQSPGLYLLN